MNRSNLPCEQYCARWPPGAIASRASDYQRFPPRMACVARVVLARTGSFDDHSSIYLQVIEWLICRPLSGPHLRVVAWRRCRLLLPNGPSSACSVSQKGSQALKSRLDPQHSPSRLTLFFTSTGSIPALLFFLNLAPSNLSFVSFRARSAQTTRVLALELKLTAAVPPLSHEASTMIFNIASLLSAASVISLVSAHGLVTGELAFPRPVVAFRR